MAGIDQNQSDDEHPLPSFRSSHPSVNTLNPDDQLILRSDFLDLKPNNHILDFDMVLDHYVIMEILKGHPLRYALSATAHVPIIYLQQFWKTLTFVIQPDSQFFTAQIDHFETRLTLKRLRRILSLPAPDQFPGKQDYDEFAPEDELLGDIFSLGYSDLLPSTSKFKRMFLPLIWYTLFSILNRCLTSKHTGFGRCSLSVLRLFHGVAFNRHYNYAILFWNELIDLVSDKKKPSRARNFIPFQRFLQIIIRSMMRSNRDIPRRLDAPTGPEFVMHFLKITKDDNEFPFVMPLSEDLLSYADQMALSVVQYRQIYAPMVQPEPEGPTPGATHASGE